MGNLGTKWGSGNYWYIMWPDVMYWKGVYIESQVEPDWNLVSGASADTNIGE